MKKPYLGLTFCLAFSLVPQHAWAQGGGEVRGVVRDAWGGEPLRRVEIQLQPGIERTNTDADGRFVMKGIAPGDYVLRASTVGYRLVKKEFSLGPGEIKEFEIALTPDTLRQTTSIQVSAAPYEAASNSASELSLRGTEARNLASVLADDPLRAVQGLPGVRSDDDFNSRFSLRGADFDRIGLYLDDILLHAPFHMVQGEPVSGSLTIMSGDTLDTIDLHTGAFPLRYADSTAGALSLDTRQGSRVARAFRLSASASNSSFSGEGPLGTSGRGDWLATFRKSYLQYLIKRLSTDPSVAFGFIDSQGQLSYDLDNKNHVSLSMVDGFSNLDRTSERSRLGLNTTTTGDYHFTLATLAWRYASGGRFLLTTRGAYMREKFEDDNPNNQALAGGRYGEWVWNTEGAWLWSGQHSLAFGGSVRRIRDSGFINRYQFNPVAVRRLDDFRGLGLRGGGWAEDTWRGGRGRLTLSAGLRWDDHSVNEVSAVSPQVTLSVMARSSTRINFGWGQYLQDPDLAAFYSRTGNMQLLPERANSLAASVEQMLDDRTRLRVEFYHRQDRDLLFRPLDEPRIIAGKIFNPPLDPPLQNALRGYASGVEVFLQRRSANRLAGWVSYELSYARSRDDALRLEFPADRDQRHTANAYLSYRLRPTVNLSVKAVYGSGFPIPGFYRLNGGSYFLSDSRNQLRLKVFQRVDLRVNKAFLFDRWRLSLYGEVINALNRNNVRFETFNGYNPKTAAANLKFDNLIPILPSAGVVFEF